MKRCTVCGEIVADDVEVCPVCKAKTFVPVEEKAKYACEHVVGDGVCDDKEIMDGLHAHFTGECTEVGMYLAMSRVAEREGYPEVAEAFKLLLKRILKCVPLPKQAHAKASLPSPRGLSSSISMPFMIPFTRWQRMKLVTAQALPVF